MDKRKALLDALLPLIPFEGWNNASLRRAAENTSIPRSELDLLFPSGMDSVIDFFIEEMLQEMQTRLKAVTLTDLKIRERIATAAMALLDAQLPHREAVRSLVARNALPWNIPQGMKLLYKIVDTIWYSCGDNATDFNFYTKRLLLAGVYSSTVMIWLDDKTQGQTGTREFLLRRIEGVMQIQKWKAGIGKFYSRLHP